MRYPAICEAVGGEWCREGDHPIPVGVLYRIGVAGYECALCHEIETPDTVACRDCGAMIPKEDARYQDGWPWRHRPHCRECAEDRQESGDWDIEADHDDRGD